MAASDQTQLGVPPPEYRPTRDYDTGSDSSMRNLALAAVGIAAVVMGGVWYMSGRHHAGIPVIEAETTPLRIKPTNPGGMQIAGADDATLGDGKEADALAPPPEAPAPQVLQMQARAANAAATVPPPSLAAIPLPSAPPPPRFALAPVTALPAPPAAIVPPRRPLPAPDAGGVQVQLAALDSAAAATAAWTQLSHRAPDLLDGHSPAIARYDRDGKVFWRLRTGGFADIATATQFCTRLRAKGAGCAIATF